MMPASRKNTSILPVQIICPVDQNPCICEKSEQICYLQDTDTTHCEYGNIRKSVYPGGDLGNSVFKNKNKQKLRS